MSEAPLFSVTVEGNSSGLGGFVSLLPIPLASTSERPDVIIYDWTAPPPPDPALACNETDALLRLPWFWTALSFQLFLAPAAILFNLILFVLLCRKSLLSYNVRLLLANLSLWATVGSAYLLGKTLWTGWAALAAPCDVEAWLLPCKLQELPLLVAEVMTLLSLWALAADRAVAACRLGPTEKSTKEGSCLGQCLAGLLWSLGVAAVVSCLLVYSPRGTLLPYCNFLFTFDGLFTRVACVAVLVLELLALAIYACVLKGTRAKAARRHERDSYSVSWQVYRARLVEVTEMLAPAVLLHGLLWTPIAVAALVQTETLAQGGLPLAAHLSEWLFHDVAVLYFALHPLFILWCAEALRREARDCCAACGICLPVNAAQRGQSSEFDILGSVWAKGDGKEEEEGVAAGRLELADDDRPEEILQLDPMIQYVDNERPLADPYEEMMRSEAERSELMRVTQTTYATGAGTVTETVTTTTTLGGDDLTSTDSRLSSAELRSRFLDGPGSPPLAKEDSGLETIQEHRLPYDDDHTYDQPPFDRRYQ